MAENIDKLPSQRARRRGQHMSESERKATQDAFLLALSKTANVRAACLKAGISHTTIYQWQEHDEEFGVRFRQANQDANWLLFGEAWQRAMKGEEEYVVSAGKLVYGPDGQPLKTHKKSDRMLELLLKARLPEFRDKSTVDVNTHGTIEVYKVRIPDNGRESTR